MNVRKEREEGKEGGIKRGAWEQESHLHKRKEERKEKKETGGFACKPLFFEESKIPFFYVRQLVSCTNTNVTTVDLRFWADFPACQIRCFF